MGQPNLFPKESFMETLQWFADTDRLLKMTLRNHDQEAFEDVRQRIINKYGDSVAQIAVNTVMSSLVENEGWVLNPDEPSDLTHIL